MEISRNNNIFFAKTAIFSLIFQIGGTGITFLLLIALARLLKIEDYGDYIYALTWLNILVLVSKFGLDMLLVRYVSAYESKQQWDYLRGVIIWSFKIALLSSIIITAMLMFSTWLLTPRIGENLANLFYITSSIILFVCLAELAQSILRGLHHIILSQLLGTVLRPFILSLAVLTLYFTDFTLSAFVIIVANLFTGLIIVTISIILTIYHIPKAVKKAQAIIKYEEWIATTFPLFILSGTLILINQTDIVMLGIMKNTKDAGIYASIANISIFVSFGLGAANAFLAPMISKLHSLGDKQKLQDLVTRVTRGIFVFTILASIFLIIVGESLLSLFGKEFLVGYSSLIVLLLGQIVNSLAGSVGLLMTMTGNQTLVAKVFTISAILNITLNFILIPILGMFGAAIATGMSIIFRNIVLLWFVKKYIGINSTIFGVNHRNNYL